MAGRAGPRITYARQRSFKADESLNENDIFNAPLVMAQQFSSSRQIDTGLENEEDNSTGRMKSIHELREAGVNSRFMDDIEELFEDIKVNIPLGRRRSGYLELASKMRDKTWVHKFRANDFDTRLLSNLNQQTDEIICFALSFIFWCLLNEDTSVQVISNIHAHGGIPMLLRMLDVERDIRLICKDRKTNMSKATQGLVGDIRDLVEKSTLFAEKKPKLLSPRVMGLKVLECVIRRLKETGAKENILPLNGAKKLVGIIAKFTAIKDDSQFKRLDALLLESSVSVLESYTIGIDVPADQQLSASEYMTIADLFSSFFHLDWPQEQLNHIQFLTLRTILNMSNNQNSVCDMFADSSLLPNMIEHIMNKFSALAGPMELEKRIVEVDLLILGLGVMINFAELSEKARMTVNVEVKSPSGEMEAGLDALLRIFLERLECASEANSMEESQSNVAFGYLAILLGNLCLSTGIRNRVELKMPKGNLDPLFTAIEEFISHHHMVDAGNDDEDGTLAAFTARLGDVMRRLKERR
ncbi:hypothetical protein RUND412_011291 [Rhizina undulata]